MKNHINGELPNGLLVDIVCVEKALFFMKNFLNKQAATST